MKKSELKEMIKQAMLGEEMDVSLDSLNNAKTMIKSALMNMGVDLENPMSTNNTIYSDGVDDVAAMLRDGRDMEAEQHAEAIADQISNKISLEEAETVDVDIEKEVDIDDESTESDIEVDTMMPGESETEQEIQGLLMKAQEEAAKLGDEKLTDQIGNTITYFTRAHISQVDEAEDYNSDVADISMDNPSEDAEVGFSLEESLRFQKLAGIIKEELPSKKEPSEVVTLKKYLEGSGSTSLKAINNQQELKSVLGIIFNNMADSMKKNSNAMKVLDIINARLK